MARVPFRRIFVAENRQTGDGRIMSPGALRWETDPQVLRYMPVEQGWGHQGARAVGTIEGYERDADGAIWATGFVEDTIPAAQAMLEQLAAGLPLGVSVDLDDVTVEIVDTSITVDDVLPPGPVDMENTGRRVALVHYDTVSMTMGSSPLRRHARGVQASANDPDPGGEVWWSFSMDEVLERFTDGRIRAATVCDIPAFDFARMGTDGAASTESTEPEADEATDPEAVAASSAPPAAPTRVASAVVPVTTFGTLTAAAVPQAPPAAWFEMPEPTDRTPLTVTDDGRVFGHMWAWSDCHTASADGSCLLAPHSSPGLPWFHTGYLVTDEGQRVPVGALTIGGGHADERGNATAAREHYDNVATVWADVVVTEGRHGGWACGAVRPGLSAEQLRSIRASVPSGDWRGVGGHSELIGIHQVVHPGFPLARVDSHGEPLAIVAAGTFTPAPSRALTPCDVQAAVDAAVAPLRAEMTRSVRGRLRTEGTEKARKRLRGNR